MSTARLKVSGELLARALHLPLDGEVEDIWLVVSHESIPEDATEVTAIMRRIHGIDVFDSFRVVERRSTHSTGDARRSDQ